MGIQHTTHEKYNEIVLSGTLNLASLTTLTPFFSSFFQITPVKDIVLNLREVTNIDSSIIRLFLNCYKKLTDIEKTLYILNPSIVIQELLSTTNLTKVIPVISDLTEIYGHSDTTSSKYTGYFYPDGDLFRLRCSCGVCGSQDVIGYHFDPIQLKWSWNNESYIPICTDTEGNIFDYFGLQPIVCTECFMCGVTPGIFNLVDISNTVEFRSSIDEKTKVLHSKAIGKRKKLVDNSLDKKAFLHPRDKITVRLLYQLADTCERTTSVYKSLSDPFLIGFINFLLSNYSEPGLKKEYLSISTEWLNMAMQEKRWKNNTQESQLHYFLFVSNLLTENEKATAACYESFSEMIEKLPEQTEVPDFSNPYFWYQKCKSLWSQLIDYKSM